MNQIITPKAINFKELVKNSNTTLSLNVQDRLVQRLNDDFTEDEQRWYIANLYMYMNYHPTNDYPINLEHVFGMIGFANKENAKRTLKNNFTEGEDYKNLLVRRDEQKTNEEEVLLVPTEKQKTDENRGGHNKETVMLNVDTFKNLCMMVKTDKGKQIRKYYVKLENVYNEIVNDEIQQRKRELEEQKTLTDQTMNKLQLLELENQEKQNKINLLTRKTNKFELGESVYIFHSTFENKDLYKIGRTKNANVRDSIHKTASYKGILLQVKCVDCVLLERIVHFLLNKYRCANRREWFSCSYDVVKNSIYYGKAFIEDEIDFTNSNLIDDTYSFIKTISIKRSSPPQNNLKIHKEKPRNIFTTLDFKAKDINNFEQFLTATCEIDANASLSYITIKNQYKIWSKTAKHIQLKKFIEYLKKNYTTSMKRYNPLVSTSKLTPHFNGLKLKKVVLEFESPKNENNVIENFLYEKCQRSPGYRITIQECFEEFEKWYVDYYKDKFTYVIKENIKKYFDIQFIRLRTNKCDSDSSTNDNRLGGWLGFALNSNNQPEPIKHYKPKNAKVILQINSFTNEIINKWDSISELSDYIKKSRSITSSLVQRHEQIYIDDILCILQYQ